MGRSVDLEMAVGGAAVGAADRLVARDPSLRHLRTSIGEAGPAHARLGCGMRSIDGAAKMQNRPSRDPQRGRAGSPRAAERAPVVGVDLSLTVGVEAVEEPRPILLPGAQPLAGRRAARPEAEEFDPRGGREMRFRSGSRETS
jgi:hypothetical protein